MNLQIVFESYYVKDMVLPLLRSCLNSSNFYVAITKKGFPNLLPESVGVLHGILIVFISLISLCSHADEKLLKDSDSMIATRPSKDTLVLERVETSKVKPGETTFDILTRVGESPMSIQGAVHQAESIFDLRKIHAGIAYDLVWDQLGHFLRLQFHLSALQRLVLERRRSPTPWLVKRWTIRTAKTNTQFAGEVKGSLWDSARAAGVEPSLIVQFAEIFSWVIDFHREIKSGDIWNFAVEELFVDGKPMGWGRILQAEYVNGGQSYKAFFYEDKRESLKGYFNESGESLQRKFLRSPIKFGRVTSGFSRRRFHPVKKVYRPHRGVDYGAPTGTKIHSIGDGRVVKIGRYGGAGRMISLQHPGGYKTQYLHLSRFAKGMKLGSKVRQNQVIGYVGKSGLATGPHLHFELFKQGKYQDPLRVRMPASRSIPRDLLPQFMLATKYLRTQL